MSKNSYLVRKSILIILCLLLYSIFFVGCKKGNKEADSVAENIVEESSKEDKEPVKEETTNEPEDESLSVDYTFLHPVKKKYTYLSYTDKYKKKVEYYAEALILNSEEGKEYKELSEALSAKDTKDASQNEESFISSNKDYDEQYLEMDEEYRDDYFENMYFQSHDKVYPVRADDVVFSDLHYSFGYFGGAHPYTVFYTENYDTKTGRELDIKDVVKDFDKLEALIREELKEYEDAIEENLINDFFEMIKKGETEYVWNIGYEDITFYFNQYCLGPYASGYQIVHIPFDKNRDIIDEKYINTPDQYILTFIDGDDLYADINGDGQKEKVSMSGYADENNNAYHLYVYVDDNPYEIKVDNCINVDSYLVREKGGDCIISCETSSENEDTLKKYEFKEDKLIQTETLTDGGLKKYDGIFSERVYGDKTSFSCQSEDVLTSKEQINSFTIEKIDNVEYKRVTYDTEKAVEEEESPADTCVSYYINNPNNGYYYYMPETRESAKNYTLTEVLKEPNDITDIDEWFAKYELNDRKNNNSSEYKPALKNEYNADTHSGYILELYDKNSNELKYKLDLSDFYYPIRTSDCQGIRDGWLPEYRYCIVERNIAYISLFHMTYAETMPYNAYIIAVDLSDGKLIFKSDPLTCNSFTFEIIDDSIFCGYGFTNEPDFIYQLNKLNGTVRDTVPVKSAPDYIFYRDKKLYVRTYDTDYIFEVGYPRVMKMR